MKKLLVITVIILSAFYAKAQWVRTGPYGGNINTIGVSDSILITGTGCEVYLSNNNGSNWVLNSLNGFNCYLKYNSKIIAGNDSGIFVSVNNGVDWNRLDSGILNSSCFFSDGINIYAGTRNAGVFFSSDEGASWVACNNGLTSLEINSIYSFDGILYAGTNGSGIFISNDNGQNWIEANSGIPTNSVIYDFNVLDSAIYTSVYGTGIYKSVNSGNSWSFGSGLNSYVTTLEVCGNILYAGTTNGVYKTTNGSNWTMFNTGLINKYVNELTAKADDLFAATKDGIYLLNDGTDPWLPVYNGIYNNATVKSITGSHNSLFACSNYGIFKTSDGGSNWTFNNNGISGSYFHCLSGNWDDIYAGVSNKIYKSSNSGQTWNSLITLTGWAVTSIALSGSNVFASCDNGLSYSNNNGTSWFNMSNGIADSNVVAIAVNGNHIFAGTDDNGIFYSSDYGTTWTAAGSGMSDYILSLVINNTDLYAGTYNGIFKSADSGLTWTHVFYGSSQFENTVFSLSEIVNNIFACTADGIIYSKNDGADWYEINDGLTNHKVHSIGTDETYIYAGTENGIWKRPLSDFNITSIQSKYKNLGIYIFPNPATDLLYINCTENADVEIINLQGQVVATKILSGKNESVVVSSLAKGVYVVKVKTEQGVVTKKIVKQ